MRPTPLAALWLLAAACSSPQPAQPEPSPTVAVPPSPTGEPAPVMRELTPEEARAANLPPPDIKELPIEGDNLVVRVTATGEVFLGDRAVSRDRLQEAVQRAVSQRPGLGAVLQVDNRVAYGEVVKLMDLLREAGIEKISLGVQRAP